MQYIEQGSDVASDLFMNEANYRIRASKPLGGIVDQINTAQWEAEGLLSQSEVDELGRFHEIHRKYRVAILHYFSEQHNHQSKNSRSLFYALPEYKMNEYRKIIYGGEPDLLSEEINEIINNLKSQLKKYIS